MIDRAAEVAGVQSQRNSDQPQSPMDQSRFDQLLITGRTAHHLGQLDLAENCYRQALSANSNSASVWHLLGVLASQRGQLQQAEEFLVKAIELDSDVADYHRNLGEVLHQNGQLQEAILRLERAIRLHPSQPDAWVSLSETLLQLGELTPSLDCLAQALQLNPTHMNARLVLGNSQKRIGELDLAIGNYRFVLKHQPENVAAAVNLASVLRMRGETQEALTLLRNVIQHVPNSPVIAFNLANTLVDAGQFSEAKTRYISALPSHPHPAKVLHNLSSVMKFTAGDRAQLNEWEAIARSRISSDEDSIQLHFALGKAHDDLGEYQSGFEHYQQGNQLVPVEFDPSAHHQRIDRLCERWSPDFVQTRESWGTETQSPIFIVGMPRSGTTLVEQILASHSQVRALGERDEMGQLVTQLAESLGCENDLDRTAALSTEADFHSMSRDYFKEVALAAEETRFTDKMPTNFLLLGWIGTCFPQASIIHICRDPRDVCLSCYFQNFSSRMPYAFDLTHLAAYYQAYERLMQHWQAVFPGRILNVQYEDLVETPAEQGRRIVEACGLDWEENCLKWHSSDRSIRTASTWQARQSIYTSSRQRWRNYREQIGPLLAEFGDQPEPR